MVKYICFVTSIIAIIYSFILFLGAQFKINEDAERKFQLFKTPDIIVCADKFLIETSPEIVKYWDKHNLTPFAGRKDVKYFVLYPESDSLLYHVKNFFSELRVQYEVFIPILISFIYLCIFFLENINYNLFTFQIASLCVRNARTWNYTKRQARHCTHSFKK